MKRFIFLHYTQCDAPCQYYFQKIFKNKVQLIGFQISHYTLNEPKRVMNFHKHNTMELSYVTSGGMIFTYVDAKGTEHDIPIFSKQLLVIAPNVLHKTSIMSSLDSVGVELTTDDNKDFVSYLRTSNYVKQFTTAVKMLDEMDYFFIVHDAGNLEYSLTKLQKYIDKSNDAITVAMQELDLKRILLEVLTCKNVTSAALQGNIYIKKALSVLESNYDKNLSIEEIAMTVGISTSYLQHLFKQELNSSVKKYLNKIRIERAQKLIVETNYSIKQIATTVGYNTVQDFNKNFKVVCGKTPTEFKRDNRKPVRYFNNRMLQP